MIWLKNSQGKYLLPIKPQQATSDSRCWLLTEEEVADLADALISALEGLRDQREMNK